jgi:hypothetical protein
MSIKEIWEINKDSKAQYPTIYDDWDLRAAEHTVQVEITRCTTDEFIGDNDIPAYEKYEPKGYELHAEEFLDCPACHKKLVSFLVVKKDVQAWPPYNDVVFQTKCPKCKVDSFKKRFNMVKLYLQAVEPYGIADMITTIVGDVPLTKLEIR